MQDQNDQELQFKNQGAQLTIQNEDLLKRSCSLERKRAPQVRPEYSLVQPLDSSQDEQSYMQELNFSQVYESSSSQESSQDISHTFSSIVQFNQPDVEQQQSNSEQGQSEINNSICYLLDNPPQPQNSSQFDQILMSQDNELDY